MPGRRPALVYIWDRAINGAAAARNAGIDRARGDIVVFCDDDVAPEAVVIERLLAHYARVPDVVGLAPLITNYARPAWTGRVFHRVFLPRAVPRRAPAHLLVPMRLREGRPERATVEPHLLHLHVERGLRSRCATIAAAC